MSTIAKVLVVVILILSVAFAALTGQLFAKREKLRKEYEDLQTDATSKITASENARKELQGAKDKLDDELNKTKNDVTQLKTDNEHLKKGVEEKTEQITKLDAQITNFNTTIGQLNSNMKAKDDRLAGLEKDLGETRDKLRTAEQTAREKEIEAQKLAQQAKESGDRLKEVEVALKDAKQKIEILTTKGGQYEESTQLVQSPVDAKVIKVDRSANLVVINRGREQGVEVGYIFTVFRGDAYLGDLRIESVAANVAAGAPVSGTSVGTMREGDNASTRIR
ncbi:MAG: hypothetical protein AB1696_10280 [Planctomycetota bacterium]